MSSSQERLRDRTPSFTGDLKNEEEVLQWLVKNRSTGEESEDVIEAVSASSLETMVESVENLAVLFCKCVVKLRSCLTVVEKLNKANKI